MTKDIFNRKPNKNRYDEDDRIKFKTPVYVRDDLEVLNRLLNICSSAKRNYQKKNYVSGGKRKGNAYKTSEQNQRVTFKISYSNSIASHDKYRKHYMPQENKDYVIEKPERFGMTDDEYDNHKVPLNFKCIVSPESQNIDLQALVESFIRRVENQTGYKLIWQGCIHTDTEHRHAHIVINGRDKNGEDVYFNKDTIQLMRLMCSNAATQMIGGRTPEQIEASKKNLIKAKRWSDIDEKMELLVKQNDFTVSRKGLSPEFESRLAYLSKMRLAKIDWLKNTWKISKEYKDVLQAAGRYNTFLEEYCKNLDRPVELYTGGGIKGKVEKVITFDKDEAWNDAIIVDTGQRRVYVPVWQLQKEDLQGKTVSIRKTGNETKISRQVSDRSISVIE